MRQDLKGEWVGGVGGQRAEARRVHPGRLGVSRGSSAHRLKVGARQTRP